MQHGWLDTQLAPKLPGCGRWAGRETCVSPKVLQMKVIRLEHLVELKDRRISELTRRGIEPQ